MELVNWNIAKHPVNYLIIVSMLVILGFSIHLVMAHLTSKPLGGPTLSVF